MADPKKPHAATSPAGIEASPPDRILQIDDLEQVRVLADPLRVRILEALCEEARTTKQVAELLEEKPTRLYHHVDALERVGLIRLAATRPNRGTVEKYYAAVARAFRVNPTLFDSGASQEEPSALRPLVQTMLDRTTADLGQLLDVADTAQLEEEGLLGFLEIHADAEEIEGVRRELKAILDRLSQPDEDTAGAGRRRYRLTLAYFPIDLERTEGEDS